MKVLLIHNFYQSSSPSGEDAVYRNEAAMLRDKGIEVIQYEKHNDEIAGPLKKLKTTIDSIWSKKTYQEVSALIKKEKPDIAHFHNIWYLISPSAYYACKDAGVPVVQTLHNFRMFCANGLLLRNGRVCEDCISHYPWRSIMHGCYRDSSVYSVPVAVTEIVHQKRGTWVNAVDAYIALTEFGKQKFIECGLPESKIFVKPNFLSDPHNFPTSALHYAVFIGRLSEEKGIDVLIDAFQILESSHPRIFTSSHSLIFKIVGDGPLMSEVKKKIEDGKIGEWQRAKGDDKIMGRWEDLKMGQSKDGKLGEILENPGKEVEKRIENGKIGEGLKAKGVDIEFAGRKSHQECMEILKKAMFLVMPAVCYENFPLTIIEAFACGKPVIASRLGAMAAIVEDNKTGLLFEPGNAEDLASKINWMIENKDACVKMGENARSVFERKYTADLNYEMLMDIYIEVMKMRRH